MTPELLKEKLFQLSGEQGFLATGIARSRKLEEYENHFNQWLRNGYAGEMAYLNRNVDKRLDPGLLVEGAKSVVTFLLNYYPENQPENGSFKIARYAQGKDYHSVLKDKIHQIADNLKQLNGEFNYRVFVDSAPIMERQWAALAGLGWIGKNTLLLRQGVGSWFFIGTLVCDIDLPPDTPATDHCGTCTACIDACPTQAFVAEGVLDATKCISYHTIELKHDISDEFKGKSEDWIFGCDICQEVCPWNRFSKPHNEPEFKPNGDWLTWDKKRWKALTESDFQKNYGHSAITRAGYDKLVKNIEFNS